MRIVLAALVAVAVAALVLLGDEVEVPVAVPVAALLEFPLLALPTTPPKTFAGTVESLAFAAADLNESRVSCPLELQLNENLVDRFHIQHWECNFIKAHLRRIDDSDHAGLAVSLYTTVVPDRVGVVDGQRENGFLLVLAAYCWLVIV